MFRLVGQKPVFLMTILHKIPIHIISKVGLSYDVGGPTQDILCIPIIKRAMKSYRMLWCSLKINKNVKA